MNVDVWLIDLDDRRPDPTAGTCVLTPAERARAARFFTDELRSRWRTARIALREILSRYVEVAPEALLIETGTNGKPYLRASDGARSPHFNLSHSGSFGLLAVSHRQAVGVDIEMHRDLPDLMRIARRFFAEQECAALMPLAEVARHESFFRCWTRKEAVLKATSEGIGENLHRLAVAFGAGEPARVLMYQGSSKAALAWTLHDLACPPGYSGALALRTEEPVEVKRYRYRTD